MNTGRMVIAQLLDFLPKHEFNRCVRRYRGNFHCRRLSCYDQFLCLTFAQLTGCESLRQIETCLGAMGAKLYHAGWHASPARSTLADANERRDWRIWAEFAQVLIARARKLYDGETFGAELDETAYVLDATIIDLCLSLFPWARFHHGKGAVNSTRRWTFEAISLVFVGFPTRASWMRPSSTVSFRTPERSTSSTAATWTSHVCVVWSKAPPISSSAPRRI